MATLTATASFWLCQRVAGTFTVRAKLSPGDYAWIEVEDNSGPSTPTVRNPSQHHGLDIAAPRQ